MATNSIQQLYDTEKLKSLFHRVEELTYLSKCLDKKTAAILVNAEDLRVLCDGVNGGPIKGRQCLCLDNVTRVHYSCIHAEVNCLLKYRGTIPEASIMICSKQPCCTCAAAIVNSGLNVKKVFFRDTYWDDSGLQILAEAGIQTEQYNYYGRVL